MTRLNDEEIRRLKQEVSLERLVEAKGVKLKRHGKDLLGLCPFHDDREPSLVVTPNKNLWHCLGTCQTGGSVIDWVMKAEGVSFRYAVELLRADLPSLAAWPEGPATSSPARPPPKRSTVPKLPVLGERTEDDEALLREVVDYYHATLKQNADVLVYLERRGIRNDEAIERFRLGYANRTLGYRLPGKHRHDGAKLRGRLERLGIYRRSGHEHLCGSLIIPVFDEAGHVVEMYGRKITPSLRKGTPLHLYLPGPHHGVWNHAALTESTEIILCESLIDALTFWCAGYRNVTAAFGAEGCTDEHVAAFERHGTQKLLIAYDRDEAGDRAAQKLADRLSERGVDCYRVMFPKNMDANEYALKVGPAEKSLGLVLRQAAWLCRGKLVRHAQSTTTEAPGAIAKPSERASTSTLPPPPAAAIGPVSSNAEDAADAQAHIHSLAAELTAHEHANSDELDEPLSEASTPEPPSSSPAPAAGAAAASASELSFVFGDRRWRVRGLDKNTAPEQLRVNLFVSRDGGAFHVDTLELYSARQRAAYVKQAAEELGLEERVLKHELGAVLLRIEEHQEEQKRAAAKVEKPSEMPDEERKAALELLRDPKLFERILGDFRRAGVVGEETNKLVGYLAATSRKLDEPLAVILQSSSAAGKSSLMDAVLSLMPEEERVQYSAMTGQSLFYMGEQDLSHKILAIVEEEGAERASYALKLLQSEGELTIASTGKDPATGRLVTQEYRVEGPVMIFLTTTAIEVDEELLNRCLVLTVDEGREQTRAIHELQREAQTLEGLLAKHDRARIRRLHQNAQRLIRPLAVVNPFARELRFLDHQTRTRRDHMKYLALIKTITLLHQYQREVKEVEHRGERIRYVEVSREDIELANRLAHEVLGRSLDELPPQTSRLLGLIDELVGVETKKLGLDRADYRFSRRQVREHTRWSYEQLRVHLGRLVELEYLLVHRGGRGQSFSYELLYDGAGQHGERFIAGLVDARELGGDACTISTLGGPESDFGVRLGAHTGEQPDGYPAAGDECEPQLSSSKPALTVVTSAETRLGDESEGTSYPTRRGIPSLAARAAAR